MKKNFKVVLVGAFSAALFTGCVNMVVQKDPRAALVEDIKSKDIALRVSSEIAVPLDEAKAPVSSSSSSSAKVESAPPEAKAESKPSSQNSAPAPVAKEESQEVEAKVADSSKKSDGKKEDEEAKAPSSSEKSEIAFNSKHISTIALFSKGGSFNYSLRDDLASGALVSKDDQLRIVDLETDLSDLSCEKLVDNDLFHGIHCSYDELKAAIGDQFKMRLLVEDSSGAQGETYAYFEVSEAKLAVNADAVIKVVAGSEVVLNPAAWLKQGVISSSDSQVYVGNYKIDHFNASDKVMDKAGQYVLQLKGMIEDLKAGEETSGVVVVGDSSKNYVEVKVIIQIVEAKDEWAIDDKTDSDEVIVLKKRMHKIIEKYSAARAELEKEGKPTDELDKELAEIQSEYRAKIASLQGSVSSEWWVIDAKADSAEVQKLKQEVSDIIQAYAEKRAEMEKNGAKDEELSELDAELDAVKKKARAALDELLRQESGGAVEPEKDERVEHASSRRMSVIRGSDPCQFSDETKTFLMVQMTAAEFSVSESAVTSTKLTSCTPKQIPNPDNNINGGWEGLYEYDVTYLK